MILYHNTSNDNAVKIAKEGIICGLRAEIYGKGSEAEGAGIWCTTQRGYGYGGATITFEIDNNDESLRQQNDTEYIVYRNISPSEITDTDLVVSSISSVSGHTGTLESDIPTVIKKFGKDKALQVFKKNENKFISPYNYDMLLNLIETGNKILKGNVKLTESDEWDFDDEPTYRELFEQYIEELKELLPDLVISDIIESKNGMLRANIKYKDRKTVLSYVGEYEGASVGDKYQSYTDDVEGVANFLKKNFILESKDIDGKESIIEEINRIVDTCKKYSITKELRKYTVPIMRDYQLRYNPTADSRRAPWIYLIDEINSTNNEIDSTLGDFIDGFIREGNQCIEDNVKTESKKLEEASRNELLAKSKAETITRYNKSAGYKGFSLVDIDTTAIKTRDSIVITNRVGNYFDSVELDDILYWVGLEVTEARDNKMTQKVVEKSLLGAMDGMDIKVDCNCGDFIYRFAYMATQFEYKYGKPETRPSNITNPDGYGAMCKHLIALLSNKSWVSQVASTLQQWIIDEIEWVRDFLKMSEEEFKLPDEYARYLGKHGAMKKFWDKQPDEEPDEEQDTDSDETNEDSDSDNENEETTNDNPDTEDNEEDTKL